MISTIAVIGAGTMGSGIAFACVQAGYKVVLFDIQPEGLAKAQASNQKNIQFLLDKAKITEAEAAAMQANLVYSSRIEDCKADLVIEAIVEKLAVKQQLFQQLAAMNSSDTILASNTSSLSITAIQQGIPHADRVAGLHFFNPAHIMKLVEVIKGKETSEATIHILVQLCEKLGKAPVVCKDAPGFIVNRVARPYYLESMYLVEQGVISFEDMDRSLTSAGFKMGPFALMDLIGMDINLAVSQSVYEAFDEAPRFKPNNLQIEKVSKGELGKKTGKGFYEYV